MTQIEELETHFDIDNYRELYSTKKPVIYISPIEIFHVHKMSLISINLQSTICKLFCGYNGVLWSLCKRKSWWRLLCCFEFWIPVTCELKLRVSVIASPPTVYSPNNADDRVLYHMSNVIAVHGPISASSATSRHRRHIFDFLGLL